MILSATNSKYWAEKAGYIDSAWVSHRLSPLSINYKVFNVVAMPQKAGKQFIGAKRQGTYLLGIGLVVGVWQLSIHVFCIRIAATNV